MHSAAAIAGRADFLLTWDSLGFPESQLRNHGLRVTNVDRFLCEQFNLFPDDFVRVIRNQVSDLTSSRLTCDELLKKLDHPTGVPQFSAKIQRYLNPD